MLVFTKCTQSTDLNLLFQISTFFEALKTAIQNEKITYKRVKEHICRRPPLLGKEKETQKYLGLRMGISKGEYSK